MTKQELFISRWVWICIAMVLVMIGIGGFTRLSGSGLSIVEWKPPIGIIPPLSEGAWLREFELYQSFPEFKLVNNMMTLSEFKFIYLTEYFHRFWGRAMGLVLTVPTIYAFFNIKKVLPRLGLVWFLSIAQAAMGWYMVKSGLVDNPMVSPFRLTAHLLLALLIIFVLSSMLGSLKSNNSSQQDRDLFPYISGLLFLVTVTIIYGGLTAGNHAGLIYNTFPDMNGSFIPHELLFYKPWWNDLITNPASIQFVHRVLASVTAIFGLGLFLRTRGMNLSKSTDRLVVWIAGIVSLQFSLGILTLIKQVPIALGVAHQVTACLLFTLISVGFWRLFAIKERMYNTLARQDT